MPRDPQPGFFEHLANRRPPWFWWLLAFILASCFSILCWSVCIAVFSHPEKPENYALLKWANRLPEPEAYTSQTAPKHPTGTAPVLRKSYLDFSEDELATVNRSLMNSYLTNFKSATFCAYLQGSYKVLDTRKLTDEDIMPNGFVVELQAMIQPDEYSALAPYPVIAELIFPTPYADSHKGFHKNDIIELNITPFFASLLHVGKREQEDDDTIVILTTVSLASKIRPPHEGPFDLVPPKEINLHAKIPLFGE